MTRQHKKTSFSLANPPDFQPELGRRKISSVLFSLRGSSYAKKKSGARSKSSNGRYQRVVVKARVVKMNRGLASLRAHVRYLKRSGTGLEKKEPNLTSEFGEVSELVKSWQGDPHHFRFIISPERGADLNLEEYKNRVLGELEKELGRDLEWFSVAHYNTDNPHCHVVIRGRDRAGEVLLIPKETIKNTFREICQKEATKELGLSFEERKFGGLEREGFASIDWVLLSKMKETGRVCVYELKGIEFKTAALKRLDFLSQYGLAEERHTGEWFLSPETEKTLRTLEKKNQLRTTIEKEFGVVAGDFVDLREKLPGQNGIFGKVLGVSILDELSGEKLALVQAADGINYVERLREEEELRAGSIVRLWRRELGAADKVIQRYSSDGALNLSKLRSDAEDWKVPPGLTFESYFSRFEQRVETLVRAGILKDLGGNRFSAPKDLADRLNPLVRLMVDQVGRVLTEDGVGKSRKQRVLLVLDEFAALGHMPFFDNALSYLAGYGVRAMVVCQSMQQLFQIYGTSQTISDNCHIRVFMTPNSVEAAGYISKNLGKKTVRYSTGTGLFPKSESVTGRPLLSEEELLRFPDDEELIFVAGARPIRCDKIISHNHPFFKPHFKKAPEQTEVSPWEEELILDGDFPGTILEE